MNRTDQERLMRYVDGELDDREAELVERWLSESQEARALHRDLTSVADLVREAADERSARSSGIADAVMARIAAEGSGRPQLKAVSGGKRETHREALLPALALALAAAAAVVMYLRPHYRSVSLVEKPATSVAPTALPVAPSAEGAELALEPDPGASIESVDFGALNGTIFMVPSGAEVTPVVWLTDDSDPSSG